MQTPDDQAKSRIVAVQRWWRDRWSRILFVLSRGKKGGPPLEITQPRTTVVTRGPLVEVTPATCRQIFGAMIVDLGIVVALSSIIVLGVMSVTSPIPLWTDATDLRLLIENNLLARVAWVVVSTTIGLSLVTGPDSGLTPGRSIAGIVLVSLDGTPLTWWQLSIRAAASTISACLAGAGIFWFLVDPYHRTWHDTLARTVLVQRRVNVNRRQPVRA